MAGESYNEAPMPDNNIICGFNAGFDDWIRERALQLVSEGDSEIAQELARQSGFEIPAVPLLSLASKSRSPDRPPLARRNPILFIDKEPDQPVASSSRLVLPHTLARRTKNKSALTPITELAPALSSNAKGKRKAASERAATAKKPKPLRRMTLPDGVGLLKKCPNVRQLVHFLSTNRVALFQMDDLSNDTIIDFSDSDVDEKTRRRLAKRQNSNNQGTRMFEGMRVVCLTRRPETMSIQPEHNLIVNLIRGRAEIQEQLHLLSHANMPCALLPTTHVLCFSGPADPMPWTMAEVLAQFKVDNENDLLNQIDAETGERRQNSLVVAKAAWIGYCVEVGHLASSMSFEIQPEAARLQEEMRRTEFELRQKLEEKAPKKHFLPDAYGEHSSQSSQSSQESHSRTNANPEHAMIITPEAVAEEPVQRHVESIPTDDSCNLQAFDQLNDFQALIEIAKGTYNDSDDDEISSDAEEANYKRPKSRPQDMATAVDRSAMYEEQFIIHSKRPDQADSGDESAENRPTASSSSGKSNKKGKQAINRKDTHKYQCERPNERGARSDGINEDIVQVLLRLKDSFEKDGEYWRYMGLQKTVGLLRNSSDRIDTYSKAIVIRGIAESTARKIAEIAATGDLRRIEMMKTPEDRMRVVFQNIYGVGPKLAQRWINRGARTLLDVQPNNPLGIRLTTSQQLGLRYYDDLLERIPREEAIEIHTLVKQHAEKIDPDLYLEIMGSFRRGQADCGDVDFILTRNDHDGRTHAGVLPRLCEALYQAGFLKHTLSAPTSWDAMDAKFMGLCSLPGGKIRHIDILCVPADEMGAALIYFTGNDIFNRSLRLKARHMGYSLNQRGLYDGVLRDQRTKEKLTEGTRICGRTEQEIFDKLKVPYYPPHQRLP